MTEETENVVRPLRRIALSDTELDVTDVKVMSALSTGRSRSSGP
jgi:hypothetical protein